MADFIKDGGPAFPGEKDIAHFDSLGYAKGTKRALVAGMTLRDYFAGKELAKVDGVSVNDIPSAYLRLADHCYRMADAMLIAREQPQPSNAAACTNSDVWNCKYCDKTTTCEALAAQSGTTSTAVLGDLSPCPFCGGMASSPEVEQIEHAGWVGRIACDHCDAVVSLQYSSTSPGIAGNAVIAAWNCRASEQPQPSNGDREGGAS